MNKVQNLDEAAEAIAAALAAKQRLSTIGSGSKAALGRRVGYDGVLDYQQCAAWSIISRKN